MKVRDAIETSKNNYNCKYTYINFCICNKKEGVYLSAAFLNEYDDAFFGDREVINVTEMPFEDDFISVFIYIDEIPDAEFDLSMDEIVVSH